MFDLLSMIISRFIQFGSVQFSRSVVPDPLWPHGLQHARPPCPSPTPIVYSNMSIESVMPSNHLILCRPLLLPPSIFPSIRVFSNESVLHTGWPKYWNFSFSISPSNKYSGLISFRMHWLDLLAVQGTLMSPTPQFKVCSSSYPLSQWYHPTSHPLSPLLLLPSIFPSIKVFSDELALHIMWSKYWRFSISPSNENSGLISFRMDWVDFFAVSFSRTSSMKISRNREQEWGLGRHHSSPCHAFPHLFNLLYSLHLF